MTSSTIDVANIDPSTITPSKTIGAPLRVDLTMVNIGSALPLDRVVYDGKQLELMTYNEAVAPQLVSGTFDVDTGTLTLTMSVPNSTANSETTIDITGFLNKHNIGKGPPGPQGVNGTNGLDGRDGKDGQTGQIGNTGPRGTTGARGIQGPKGDTGAQGDVGGIGPPGPMGDQGPQGPVGATGSAGAVGNRGIPGPAGLAGADGTTLTNIKCDNGILYFYISDGTVHSVPLCNKGIDLHGGKTTVAPASMVIKFVPPSGLVGVAYNYNLSATGGIGPYTFVATGLPAGLVCSSTGAITGTPTTVGKSTVSVHATYSKGNTAAIEAKIQIFVQLKIVAIFPDAVVNQPYDYTITVSNGTGPFTFDITGLPNNLVNTAGHITGSATTENTYQVTINVTDSVGDTGTLTTSLKAISYLTSKFAVLTGNVISGGTVPVPSSFSAANTVSLVSFSVAGDNSGSSLSYLSESLDSSNVYNSQARLQNAGAITWPQAGYISISAQDAMVVNSGTLALDSSGSVTLPVPLGFTPAECTFIFSFGHIQASGIDNSSTASNGFTHIEQALNGNVVTNKIVWETDATAHNVGTVNYIVFAHKAAEAMGLVTGIVQNGATVQVPPSKTGVTYVNNYSFVWPNVIETGNLNVGFDTFQCSINSNGQANVWCTRYDQTSIKIAGSAYYVSIGVP